MMESLFRGLSKDRPHWKTEEEVRKGWLKHLENEMDITFMAGSGPGAGLGQVTNMTDAVMRELPLDSIRPKEQDVRGCAPPVFVGQWGR